MESARNHEVQHQPQVPFESNRNPLSDPFERNHTPALQRAQRRLEGSQQKWMRDPRGGEPGPGQTLLQRLDIDRDVRQLGQVVLRRVGREVRMRQGHLGYRPVAPHLPAQRRSIPDQHDSHFVRPRECGIDHGLHL